jgi:hypothetical protein
MQGSVVSISGKVSILPETGGILFTLPLVTTTYSRYTIKRKDIKRINFERMKGRIAFSLA